MTKTKSRSRTRSMRWNSESLEDDGLLPIPNNRRIERYNSDDFLAKSRTESIPPKLVLNRRSRSASQSRSQERKRSCNFRMKYYRSLGVVTTPAVRPPSPSLSEPRVPIETQVAREDFDWKCESPGLQSTFYDELLFDRPVSPIHNGRAGIFELEE